MKKIILTNHGTTTKQSIRVKDFMNTAFKTYSLADNVRNIPGIDGLKPVQRKALFGTVKKGENAEPHIVARLAAAIAEITDYHHGTGSMESAIINLAANKFPGANNMNLFKGKGQFPSRLTDEAGAGRYIKATLSPYFRQLFNKDDDAILVHATGSDGDKIEPNFYLPLLPIVLINGATGIGTGHGVEIKSYHPEQIRDACLKVLDGKKLTPGKLVPWYRGYHGTVSRNEIGQVVTTGKLEIVNATTILITEIPIGKFLDDYKTVLNDLMEPRRNKEGEIIESALIKDYDDSSTESGFNFRITCPRSTTSLTTEQLYNKFKLISRETENFTLWNADGVLQRFESAEAVIEMYMGWRLSFYEVRRQRMIADIKELIRWQSEIIRFIRYYLANTKVFSGTPKKELIDILLAEKFVDYDRLLNMPIWNLTKDRIAELEKKLIDLKATLAALESDTATAMYSRELKAFKYDE